MRRRQFTTLLARPRLICGQINPVHLIAVLSGIAWDKEKLERFIANPDEVVPGNRMKPYTGLASSDDRAKIVAFLAQSR